MKDNEFDFEAFKKEAIQKLKAGNGLVGTEGAFTPLIKSFLEEAMGGEIDAHLAEGKLPNRKNGKGRKRVRTSQGMVDVNPPRDRSGTFDPKILPKRSKNLPNDIERQIFALYARGNSYGDIRDFLEEMYGVEISPATLV